MSLPGTYKDDLIIKINYDLYLGNNNDNFALKIFANKNLVKELNFNKNRKINEISLNLEKNYLKSNILELHFKFTGLISPFENFESPDTRKLGILLKNFEVLKKN
jgi:hypothetical protein